jgi:hypothetical protein
LTFSNVRALQNNGNTQIDLFSTPGVTLTGTQLTFTIDVAGTLPTGGTDTLSVTYNDSLGGLVAQQLNIPLFGSVYPPFTLFVTINLPNFSVVAIPATLTVDLLNSNADFVNPTTQIAVNSFTYSFAVAQPVPEPATLTLLGAALAPLIVRARRRGIKAKEAVTR